MPSATIIDLLASHDVRNDGLVETSDEVGASFSLHHRSSGSLQRPSDRSATLKMRLAFAGVKPKKGLPGAPRYHALAS